MRTAGSRRSSLAFAAHGANILGLSDTELAHIAHERDKMAVLNMLVLCGEQECVDVDSPPEKLRALIDGIIVQRRRADGKIKAGAFTFSQAHDENMVRIEHETGEVLICDSQKLAAALARFWSEEF